MLSKEMKIILDTCMTNASNRKEHYLLIAQKTKNKYYNEFLETAEMLSGIMEEKQFIDWCKEKMLLRDKNFDEKEFIQFAVESIVTSFFIKNYKDVVKIEAKVRPNSKKDVDVRISIESYDYNIEVKCARYDEKEIIESKKGIKLDCAGRIPNRKESHTELKGLIMTGQANKGLSPIAVHESKNMDNNLKQFLIDAHKKFNPKASNNEVNILFVGCGDSTDMQNWVSYLNSWEGLFTENSFENVENYSNVDLVILSNLYYKHNKFYEKNMHNSWSLAKENTFSLIFCNPKRKLDKKEAIEKFIGIFPNYSRDLFNYRVPSEKDVPSYVSDSVKITTFICELEEKQKIFLFDIPKTC